MVLRFLISGLWKIRLLKMNLLAYVRRYLISGFWDKSEHFILFRKFLFMSEVGVSVKSSSVKLTS